MRGPSWRLLDLGRRLERALVVLAAVESMLGPAPDELTAGSRYEVVLTAHESLVAYRRRYRSDTRIDAVLDLLLGDDTNPRALAFQLDRMAEHLAALPGPVDRSRLEQLLDATARAVVRAPWQEIDDSAAPIAATARTHDHRGSGPRRPRSACWTWPAPSSPAGSPTRPSPAGWVRRRDPVLDQPPHLVPLRRLDERRPQRAPPGPAGHARRRPWSSSVVAASRRPTRRRRGWTPSATS